MTGKNLFVKSAHIATRTKHKDKQLFIDCSAPNDPSGRFFYIIEIESPWTDGEKIRDIITSTFCSEDDKNQKKPRSFEDKIKSVNELLGDFSQIGEHDWVGKVNAIIGEINNNELFFSQCGRISGYLFRDNKINHITEKPVDTNPAHPLKTFESVINGRISDNDIVIIGNTALFLHLSLDRIRQIVTSMDPQSSIEEIGRILRRVKSKDVNTLIFNFNENINENDQSPLDFKLFLDDIIESEIYKQIKKTSKYFTKWIIKTATGIKLFSKYCKTTVLPIISEKIFKKKKKKNDQNKIDSKPISTYFNSRPKINYFDRKKPSNFSRRFGDFWSNLFFWLRSLVKVENRKFLFIGTIMVFLIFGFIKIQMNKNQTINLDNQNNNLSQLDVAKDLYSKGLIEIGTNPNEGKNTLLSAKNSAITAKNSPAISDQASNLLNQIQSKIDELNKATRISSNTKINFEFGNNELFVVAIGSDLVGIDQKGAIAKLDTNNKKNQSLISVDQSHGAAKSFIFSENQNSIFISTDKNFVLKFGFSSNTIEKLLNGDKEEWQPSVALSTFSTSIYSLDSISGKIWKYLPATSGFGNATSYLTKPSTLNNAVDLAIDGDIYALKSDGQVVRISKSVESTTFKVSEIPTPDNKMITPMKIATSIDSGSFFVLDKGNNRVLEYNKSGTYKKQFVGDSEIPITTFAINTKINKIWIVSEKKVFEFDL